MGLYPGGPSDREEKEPRSHPGGSEIHRESDLKSEIRGEFTLKLIKLVFQGFH
jgi:hypothetical protein